MPVVRVAAERPTSPANGGSSGTPTVFSRPAATQTGDLILVALGASFGPGTGVAYIPTPVDAGWTLAHDPRSFDPYTNGIYNPPFLFRRVAAGGDPATWSFTHLWETTGAPGNSSGGILLVYRGFDGTTPLASIVGEGNPTQEYGTLTVASKSVTKAGSAYVAFSGTLAIGGLKDASAAPPLVARQDHYLNNGGWIVSVEAFDELDLVVGATGTRAVSFAGGSAGGLSLVSLIVQSGVIDASANLRGTGALAASARTTARAAAPLSGAGTLTLALLTGELIGSGTLTAAGTLRVLGAAALAGSAGLSAVLRRGAPNDAQAITNYVSPIGEDVKPPDTVSLSEDYPEVAAELTRYADDVRRTTAELRQEVAQAFSFAGAALYHQGTLYYFRDDLNLYVSVDRWFPEASSAAPGASGYLPVAAGVGGGANPAGYVVPHQGILLGLSIVWTGAAAAATTFAIRRNGTTVYSWAATGGETKALIETINQAYTLGVGDTLQFHLSGNTAPITDVVFVAEIGRFEEKK